MLNTAIGPARERASRAITESEAVDAVIARREAGRVRPDDDALTEAHAADLVRAQSDDGSWDGDLVRTAEALLLLHGLVGSDGDDDGDVTDPADGLVRARATAAPAAERAMEWLRDRRGGPGRYGDGCSPERHAEALCHHFMGGFFSPGPPDVSAAGVRLAIGVQIDRDEEARLAASCVALRAALRWAGETTDARLHLRALHRLIARWERWEQRSPGPAVGLAMVLAVIEASPSPQGRQAVAHGLRHVERSQRADGSWPGADTFQVLETLIAALRRGYGSDALEETLARGAGLLATTQSPEDGTWGRETAPRRLRIGWHALRLVDEP